MKNAYVTVLLVFVLALAACQAVEGQRFYRMPVETAPGEEPQGLTSLLANPPQVRWERAPKSEARADYWVMPGDDPFYLFRDGIQHIDAKSALRYVLMPDGFDLLTIEEKQGVRHHPVCPSFAPVMQCIDDHTLLIVTHISCGTVSCDYDFVIIDYFNEFPFASDPPVIKEIIDYILDDQQEESYFPYRLARRFSERHRSSGNITPENPLWIDFISERFDLIRAKIDAAVSRGEIRLTEPS